MELKKPYIVGPTAGEYVAGYKVPVEKTIALTDEEARYELLHGTITPAAEDEKQTPKKK